MKESTHVQDVEELKLEWGQRTQKEQVSLELTVVLMHAEEVLK